MLYKKITILFLLVLLSVNLISATFLFVLFDAGETNGLLPVIKKLRNEKNNKVIVISEGASSNLLKRKGVPYCSLKDLIPDGVLNISIPGEKIEFNHHAGYYLPMRYCSLSDIPDIAIRSIRPDIVVTGLVSIMEKDFLEAGRKHGVPVCGFYDFYDLPSQSSIFRKIIPSADFIFVSSNRIKNGIAKVGIISNDRIILSGHPNFSRLDDIKKDYKRKDVLKKSGLDPEKKYFVFTTQYSDRNDELLILLMNTMKRKFKEYELIVAPHPNQDPEHYKKLGIKSGIKFHLLDRSKISVYEAILLSDIVFTETSTTGFEAVLLDKDLIHVLHVDTNEKKQFNIRNNLALYARNESEIYNAIMEFKSNSEKTRQIRENVIRCIPIAGASDKMINFLYSRLTK